MEEASPQFTTHSPEFVEKCVERCMGSAVDAYRDEIEHQALDYPEGDVARCESPLEEAFGRCWAAVRVGADYYTWLEPQVQARGYRLDFVVRVHRFKDFPKIAIELDGHDFHERTKAQVTARNTRDRELQQAGWQVFHVSGSEFYRDPYECVHDIHLHAVEEARACDAKKSRGGR